MSRLAFHLNIGNLWSLPETSTVPLIGGEIDYADIRTKGFSAIQHHVPDPTILDAGLAMTGMGRITSAEEATTLAQQAKDWGFTLSTWHVGTGFETDTEMDALAQAVLHATATTGHPIFIETHRATMTQDIRRTLDLVTRFPDLRFNADLSHWYTGHEMTYGDINAKFDLMAPIFERVRYIHGRIGTPCCAQVPVTGVDDDRAFVDHFKEMWRRCFEGFKKTAAPDETIAFAPELLPYSLKVGDHDHTLYYARNFGSDPNALEESDRWTQAIILRDIAATCAIEAGV